MKSFLALDASDSEPDFITVSDWSLSAETATLFYKLRHGVLGAAQVDFTDTMSPVVLLGTAYIPAGGEYVKGVEETIRTSPHALSQAFMERFQRMIWVTYRCRFRGLKSGDGTMLDTDAGWGCTLRVGQMLLLETLQRAKHNYGSNEHSLLLLIQENCLQASLSLHSLLQTAVDSLKKYPGDWFSPVSVAYLLQVHTTHHPLDQIQVLVQVDGSVYLDQVVAAATGLSLQAVQTYCYCATPSLVQDALMEEYLSDPSNSADEFEDIEPARMCAKCHKLANQPPWKSSVLLLVPLMLGLGQVHSSYFDGLKALLNFPQSVGLIGGKPRSAYYIIGHQGDGLLYLDPHHVQTACQSEADMRASQSTYHCSHPSVLPLTEVESSLAAGFFLQDHAHFRDFVTRLGKAHMVLRNVVHTAEVSRSDIEESANCMFFEPPDLSQDYMQM